MRPSLIDVGPRGCVALTVVGGVFTDPTVPEQRRLDVVRHLRQRGEYLVFLDHPVHGAQRASRALFRVTGRRGRLVLLAPVAGRPDRVLLRRAFVATAAHSRRPRLDARGRFEVSVPACFVHVCPRASLPCRRIFCEGGLNEFSRDNFESII